MHISIFGSVKSPPSQAKNLAYLARFGSNAKVQIPFQAIPLFISANVAAGSNRIMKLRSQIVNASRLTRARESRRSCSRLELRQILFLRFQQIIGEAVRRFN